MNINMERSYGQLLNSPIGAVEDYNGDGIDDFVVNKLSFAGGNTYRRLIILTKGNDWVRVSPSKEPIKETEFDIYLNPNPFNNSLNIELDRPVAGEFIISLADITGRQVWSESRLIEKDGSLMISAPTGRLSSGIYFVRCSHIASKRTVLKKAVLLR